MLIAEAVITDETVRVLAGLVGIAIVVNHVLGGINHVRTMRQPILPPRLGDHVVNQEQFNELRKEIDDDLSEIKKELKEDVERVGVAMTGRLDSHETYTHTRIHQLSDAINGLTLRVATQPVELARMIDSRLTPVLVKVDSMSFLVGAIASRLKVPIQAVGPVGIVAPDFQVPEGT